MITYRWRHDVRYWVGLCLTASILALAGCDQMARQPRADAQEASQFFPDGKVNQAPDFAEARLRQAPDRHVLEVIEHGYGVMYSYAARVAPADRWAIVAHIRSLQLARHAVAAALPLADRQALEAQP